MKQRAFTLIEVLVVIGIIAVLAALLFPVLARAKEAGKKASCLSNLRQIFVATQLYLNEFDGTYPQTKRKSDNPAIDDAAGQLDEPYMGSYFVLLYPFTGAGQAIGEDVSRQLTLACPSDPDAFGRGCGAIAPDAPALTSYLVNGYFVFGLNESSISRSSETIVYSERRTTGDATFAPFCDDLYHPWFSSENPAAPNDDMAMVGGAIATIRHSELSNFVFGDGHTKAMRWPQTFAPPSVNFHQLDRS